MFDISNLLTPGNFQSRGVLCRWADGFIERSSSRWKSGRNACSLVRGEERQPSLLLVDSCAYLFPANLCVKEASEVAPHFKVAFNTFNLALLKL